MNTVIPFPVVVMLVLLGFVLQSQAVDPPGLIGHQGRIAVNNANHDGPGFFKFALVDGTASQTFWTNDGTNTGSPGATPSAAVPLAVDQGHYSVLLGEAPMVGVSASVFANNSDVRLRTWFATAAGGPFEQLTPDRRLTTAAYAFNSGGSAGIEASYSTGDSNSLQLQTVQSSGTFTYEVTFSQAFTAAPDIELGSGWTVDAATDSGFTASATLTSQAVDTAGIVGTQTSVAMINGRPAISYRNLDGSALKFARAGDAQGATWPVSSIVTIDGALTDSGDYSSLAEVAGRPAVSYYHGATGDLRFVRAENAEGSSWPTATTVDGAGINAGWHTSLAVIGGVPAISYYLPNEGELRYAWAADAEGTDWPAANIGIVDGLGATDMGQYASMIELAGKPAIAYYDATNANLRFAFLSGSNPATPAHWTKVTVDSANAVGEHASLALVNGVPGISYYDATSGNLKFTRSANASGSSWPSGNIVTVDGGAADSGQYSALAVFTGRPAITYYDSTNKDLKFIWASDAQGSAWPASAIVTVNGTGTNMGTDASMASVNGVPAIAYHEATGNFDLRFASLPLSRWTAGNGEALPVLASGVKDGAISEAMLAENLGIWQRTGNHVHYDTGNVGIGRIPASNPLEVEGAASKTTAGSWLANSDRRIKTNVRELDNALSVIERLRPVAFRYTDAFRAAHPTVNDREYLNVIAQEFREVFPNDVVKSGENLPNGESILQVDTYPATIYSIAAIQELNEKLGKKDAEIAELEARLNTLESKDKSVMSSSPS